MAEDEKRELCELERQQEAEADRARLLEAEPWRSLMADVGKMMRAALEEAQDITEEHRRKTMDAENPHPNSGIPAARYVADRGWVDNGQCKIPGPDSIIRLAIAIFDATASANATKRLIEAQQGVRRGGLVAIGKDGRPVKV